MSQRYLDSGARVPHPRTMYSVVREFDVHFPDMSKTETVLLLHVAAKTIYGRMASLVTNNNSACLGPKLVLSVHTWGLCPVYRLHAALTIAHCHRAELAGMSTRITE